MSRNSNEYSSSTRGDYQGFEQEMHRREYEMRRHYEEQMHAMRNQSASALSVGKPEEQKPKLDLLLLLLGC